MGEVGVGDDPGLPHGPYLTYEPFFSEIEIFLPSLPIPFPYFGSPNTTFCRPTGFRVSTGY